MDELFHHVPPNEIDIVVGGPPCQGFSLTGPRNFDDKRNMLYKALFDLVKETKPKAFLIENVKGMATLYKGLIKKEIIDKFSDIGYSVNAKILNSKDFGVPQSRERLFYVGLQKGIFEFPEPLSFPPLPLLLGCSAHGVSGFGASGSQATIRSCSCCWSLIVSSLASTAWCIH